MDRVDVVCLEEAANVSGFVNLSSLDPAFLRELLANFSCTSADPDEDERNQLLISHPAVQALFYVLYTVIFTVGVSGNVLVCFVVIRSRAMQTVTNFFITNLALSDILLCVLAVPFTPLYTFLKNWIFGKVLCHLVSYSQGVSVYISTFTLTSIAIDRFFVIMYPFRPRMKLTTCLVIICCIWVFAMVATLPYGIFMALVESNSTFYCTEQWPDENSRQIFSGCTTILQFAIPFVIIALCYVRVSVRLRDRARLKPGAKSSRQEEAERERKRRTNRMLIAMVSIFGVSWLPINLVNLAGDVSIAAANWEYFQFCFFIAHAVAMSSTCYNPILYAWLNDNFRKEFRQVLPCFEAGNGTRSGGTSRRGGRSERTCNGNETVQETLLLTTSNSVRQNASPVAPTAENDVSAAVTGTVTGPSAEESVVYIGGEDQVHVSLANDEQSKLQS